MLGERHVMFKCTEAWQLCHVQCCAGSGTSYSKKETAGKGRIRKVVSAGTVTLSPWPIFNPPIPQNVSTRGKLPLYRTLEKIRR